MKLFVICKHDCYIFEDVEEICVMDETGLNIRQQEDLNGWTIKEAKTNE